MAQAAQVLTFNYEGTRSNGDRVKGQVTANNEAGAKAELRKQGIKPIKVMKGRAKRKRKKSIKAKDIALFTRQMATMMSSGVPLVQSFELIAKGSENPSLTDLVLAIKGDIEGGTTFADALAKHPKYFDALTVNLVHAGEQAGILEELLNKIATYKEKTEAIKGKVKKALFYPAAVMAVAFIITAVIMIFVIPQFESLFAGFGADLPALTAGVVALSRAFVDWWYLIFGGIGLFIYGFAQLVKRSKKFSNFLQKVSLKVPVIGNILNKAAIARFARTLSTMFAAGVPLVEAMESVAGAVGNVVYYNGIMKVRDDISTGTSLASSMIQLDLFPSMVNQMVAIGEEAGSIDHMLAKVADYYEEEVDNAVDALSSLLEPLIMVVLGGLIGTLVIAMYLPIFKMGETVM